MRSCPNCGAATDESSRFCSNCGIDLSGGTTPSTIRRVLVSTATSLASLVAFATVWGGLAKNFDGHVGAFIAVVIGNAIGATLVITLFCSRRRFDSSLPLNAAAIVWGLAWAPLLARGLMVAATRQIDDGAAVIVDHRWRWLVLSEIAKLVLLLGIRRWNANDFDTALDGIHYGALIGCSFGIFEGALFAADEYARHAAGERGPALVAFFFLLALGNGLETAATGGATAFMLERSPYRHARSFWFVMSAAILAALGLRAWMHTQIPGFTALYTKEPGESFGQHLARVFWSWPLASMALAVWIAPGIIVGLIFSASRLKNMAWGLIQDAYAGRLSEDEYFITVYSQIQRTQAKKASRLGGTKREAAKALRRFEQTLWELASLKRRHADGGRPRPKQTRTAAQLWNEIERQRTALGELLVWDKSPRWERRLAKWRHLGPWPREVLPDPPPSPPTG